ncbi:hypothetical protein BC351_01195 [Paenibacillus ferrarius]|uniref:Uncharacterized protein n=1 Tax=Paenibacillus ferrarius TaxID=1469647 RepID=A0A1V4HSM7_9BACL|nr:hypothetical protein [Paenibacillus ferrarius]OPH61887.1 hypothetical protein BC351_01195 [Paenibacillus ferrarius]
MNEYPIYVAPKKPLLGKDAAADYEYSEMLWIINSNFKSNGGIPTVLGLVELKNAIRYKVEFPNGLVDYFRLDSFDKFYELTTERINLDYHL